MTDNLDRVFLEIVYDEESTQLKDVVGDLNARLDGFEHKYTLSPNRPPRIFTDEEIEGRFLNLYFAAQKWRKRFVDTYGVEIDLDPRLLYIAVVSAFDDIERYKAYHLEKPYRDRSDAVKRSAFLTKWISKIAPFQTRVAQGEAALLDFSQPGNLDPKPALANILFSIAVSMTHISRDCQKRTWLTIDAEFQLSYDLLYRRVNEDALLATYQKITDIVCGAPVIQHG